MEDLDHLILNIESVGIHIPQTHTQKDTLDDLLNNLKESDFRSSSHDIDSMDTLLDMLTEESSKQKVEEKLLKSKDSPSKTHLVNNQIIPSQSKEISEPSESELDSLLDLLNSEEVQPTNKANEELIQSEEKTPNEELNPGEISTPRDEITSRDVSTPKESSIDFSDDLSDLIKDIEDLSYNNQNRSEELQNTPFPQLEQLSSSNPSPSHNDSAPSQDILSPRSQLNIEGVEECFKCKELIYDEKIHALNHFYHRHHFTCSICDSIIGPDQFFEFNGHPHCNHCFETKFCPQCHRCSEAILGQYVNVLDKSWHPHCFVCTSCSCQFEGGQFFERERQPYCQNCYQASSKICRYCNQMIYGDCINALGFKWHPEHFKCDDCNKAFTGMFFEYNGKPYCEDHYYERKGEICEGCKGQIKGPSIEALGKVFHSDHFTCAFCTIVLSKGRYTEKNEKAYCKECYERLF